MSGRLVSAAIAGPLVLLLATCGISVSAPSSGPADNVASMPATSAPSSLPAHSQADIRKLVEQLGGNSFAARERAQKELVRVGLPARAQLEAIVKAGSAEQKRRARQVLEQLAVDIMRSRLLWSSAGTGVQVAVSQDPPLALHVLDYGQVQALGLADGEPKWKTGVLGVVTSPLAVMGKRAYVMVGGTNVVAISLDDGTVAWKTNVPISPGAQRVGGFMNFLAAADGTIVVCVNHELAALDEKGQESWRVPVSAVKIDKSFFIGTGAVADGVLFLPISGTITSPQKNRMLAVELASGKVLWSEDSPHGPICCSPTVSQGVVYYASGPGIEGKRVTNCTMYARDARTGKLMWEQTDNNEIDAHWIAYRGQGNNQQPAVVGNNVVFGVGGKLFALDKADGKRLWTVTIPVERNFVGRMVIAQNTGLRAQGDTIYFGSEDGVFAYDAPSGKKLWRFETSRQVKQELAVLSDSLVFVITGRNPKPQEADQTPAGVYLLRLDVDAADKK